MNTMVNQDVRALAAGELDAVTGGIITAVFQHGAFRMEVSGWESGYMVTTANGGDFLSSVLVQTDHSPD